jgi:hypothetical protein
MPIDTSGGNVLLRPVRNPMADVWRTTRPTSPYTEMWIRPAGANEFTAGLHPISTGDLALSLHITELYQGVT